VSTVTEADKAAAPAYKSQLVASVYANYPCHAPDNEQRIVPDTIVDLGLPGPVMMFWQCSAWSQAGNQGLKAEPLVNKQVDSTLGTAGYVNPAATHMALLRRRARVQPLPEGESMFSVVAARGVTTDKNDTVNMAMLDISDIGVPPLVRLATFGFASSPSLYTQQNFSCSGGPLLISVSATASSKTPSQMLGALLQLDGNPNANFQVWANPAGSHMGLVGGDRVRAADAKTHALHLTPHTGTTIDSNDLWALTVLELPPPTIATQLKGNDQCATQQGGGVIASAPFTSQGGTQLICLWVSAYSHKANQTISATVLIDGNPVGQAQIFANPADTHMLLCGGDIVPGSIPPGPHTIQVVAGPNTITDVNDRISLTVLEVFR